jgi:hypothetical protein
MGKKLIANDVRLFVGGAEVSLGEVPQVASGGKGAEKKGPLLVWFTLVPQNGNRVEYWYYTDPDDEPLRIRVVFYDLNWAAGYAKEWGYEGLMIKPAGGSVDDNLAEFTAAQAVREECIFLRRGRMSAGEKRKNELGMAKLQDYRDKCGGG